MKSFFEPKNVALIGATDRKGAIGRIVLENLMLGKEKRTIYPINPKKESLLDLKAYPSIGALPEPPELVIIVTPANTVADLAEEAGKSGAKAIIIISAGFKETGAEGKVREDRLADIARRYRLRIIGPNCLGVIRPSVDLNSTFVSKMPKPGRIAFLSQSGALGSAILDWAIGRGLGFSAFVSMGSMLDVDFGDLIDFFGADPSTNSILIYMESLGSSLKNAKKFMSAARGFARTKPIIIIKSGKFQEGQKAARSHTGAMVGEDFYYDAIFDRAGAIRVDEIEDLFNCASILNTAQLPRGRNLAIVTNAGGPAVLATDALIKEGGKLAQLGDATVNTLNEFLPPYWSKSNPIDILGDADPDRYTRALETALKDPQVDGVAIIYTPQGAADPIDIAKSIISPERNKPVLAAMMGDSAVAKARQYLHDNKVPAYEFPEDVIKTYLYMYQYARNLEELYQTPEDLPLNLGTPKNYLKLLCRQALREGRTLLNEADSKKLLTAYGISATTPFLARDAAEAAAISAGTGFPLVMKISSPDISHKSDVGGVALGISSPEELTSTFTAMMQRVKEHKPDARLEGVTLQRMITRYDYELIIGSKRDPMFGPVILFGLGGTEAEFFKDVAVGLPPLNQVLARRIIERTRTHTVLSKGFRSKPPVNLRILDETLVRVSNLIVDFPEIKELDINPLVICGDSVIALDARIVLDEEWANKPVGEHGHLIISPYPTRYMQPWVARTGQSLLLRPIRPEDEELERELIAGLSEESSRFRFFYILKNITHDMLSRFCNIDYEREMAIIAEYNDKGKRRNVGVGRLMVEPSGESGEFAILVADDFQGAGLGIKLTDMLIGIGEEKGLKTIYGIVMNDNLKMIGLAKRLGFSVQRLSAEESKIVLEL